ncbi:MAG: hypothetical protein DRJ42_15535 [Deltaproteobacteria bacterium]|nr:MAG: hypothetical protein DRJ42_15535 [Deltaproteobacteria bacterium]
MIALALGGCVMEEPVGSSTGAVTGNDCEVVGAAVLPGGETFSGTMSDIAGVEAIDWTHDAPGTPSTPGLPGTAFRTVSLDGPDRIICSGLGGVTADALSYGTATVNGLPNYGYLLETEDNRDAPTGGGPILLSATRASRPTSWVDGEQSFASPTTVTVPEEITVSAGDPRRQFAFLYLGDLRCKYRGDGSNYVFDKCPGDESVSPGDTLSVSSARLHIQNGRCNAAGVLEAAVNIGSELVPAPGAPDYYSLIIFDPAGAVAYTLATDVVNGDIDITLY